MRESRVIALAGVLQGCRLVHEVATRGRADAASVEASLASVFRIDADSAAAVFGGLAGVRLGLETLLHQFEGAERNLALTRLVLGTLRLQKRLARNPRMQRALRDGIEAIQRQADHFGLAHPTVQARLADLYVETLSQLRPRVVVHGNPVQLSNPQVVAQIRALLLAAVRAAVLWRQVGGGQLRLLLRRREYAMLARGLLARSTLDRG
ncbi:high frequency lysogenization protein HflD [Dokdonella fugitiva]|jgi:high frequency lysogenization protein|uniref:High frequency lysogenization protein HflD homolog n=1 Tax=Dokdonella fugitiva TaxID=328517 RepID=A0A4R2IAC5_9GAMM|nr:high frequency lysogenization protein HflD [Dokdonella fugitiva]MBA8883204.1 high frequency lysogenization protein [Dokdonella fugitiva]TCO40338.1 high frequency lysogenization protein [Dokdonella fugitiva]